jgi:hypothetical protein
MYAKGGSKKIWHEMISFVCDSKNYIIMNKYNIVSKFLGLISVVFHFFKYGFHKVRMYATHVVVVVMEVGAECICSNTNALESQGKYIHEQTIDNE